MQNLGIIRPLTRSEKLNLEHLFTQCESPGCNRPPECAIVADRPGEAPLLIYACLEHAKSWAGEPDTAPDS